MQLDVLKRIVYGLRHVVHGYQVLHQNTGLTAKRYAQIMTSYHIKLSVKLVTEHSGCFTAKNGLNADAIEMLHLMRYVVAQLKYLAVAP